MSIENFDFFKNTLHFNRAIWDKGLRIYFCESFEKQVHEFHMLLSPLVEALEHSYDIEIFLSFSALVDDVSYDFSKNENESKITAAIKTFEKPVQVLVAEVYAKLKELKCDANLSQTYKNEMYLV